MSEHVRFQRGNGVLSIVLARPERRNAITAGMYAALAEAIEGAAGDPEIRLITLRGDGPDFAAGNDLADFLETRPAGCGDIPVWRLLRAIARCDLPILAAVHGNCVGIGTTILLHCDLVVADPSARFSMPFVDLGLVPEAASSLLIPRLAGRRRAARYLLLGEPFGPEDALAIGLVSHLCEMGELDDALRGLVASLLAKPAEALRQTQDLLRRGTREEVLERIQVETAIFTERLESAEAKRAIAGFFDKRKPTSA